MVGREGRSVSLPSELDHIDVERVAACVIDDVESAAQAWAQQHRRPRSLGARDALIALRFESLLVAVSACNVANGVQLSEAELQRLVVASARIEFIANEATR